MKENSKNLLIVIIILIVAIIAGLFAYGEFDFLPSWFKKPYRLGLDLSGGTRLIYEADLSQVAEKDRDSAMNGLRDVIERRVNLFGVSEPRVEVVQVGETYRLNVELAGIKDINQAI